MLKVAKMLLFLKSARLYKDKVNARHIVNCVRGENSATSSCAIGQHAVALYNFTDKESREIGFAFTDIGLKGK